MGSPQSRNLWSFAELRSAGRAESALSEVEGMPARQRAGRRRYLTSYVSRIEAAGDRRIRRALDDGSAVGEECHLVGIGPELQYEIVVPDRTVWFKAGAHFGEINGAVTLMNLN